MNCVAAGRGIVFRAWPCATHFLLRRTYMKRLAVVVSVLLLAVLMIGCSVDMADTSLSTSENIVSNEESLVEPSEEPVSQADAEEEFSEETSSQHQHVFSDATCTQPKTCECGETQGVSLEHSWEKATCETLKTCSVCGTTEGKYADHKWKEATCESPKTCSVCDKTEGSALEHEWKAATCTKASVCALCGKTDGKPKEHTYNNGKCTACGVKDPNYTSSEEMVWIPTKGGKKYHKYSSCSNMDGPLHVTISEAIRRGFTACKRCH